MAESKTKKEVEGVFSIPNKTVERLKQIDNQALALQEEYRKAVQQVLDRKRDILSVIIDMEEIPEGAELTEDFKIKWKK